MTDDADESTEGEPEEDDGTGRRTWERMTAPQQDYSIRDVGIGVVVAAISLVVTFGIPLAFTL
ncbi:MAG: hypothetical protein ACI9YT_001731 [Halobacteriales archaeon]|jgi:hypothetical protein